MPSPSAPTPRKPNLVFIIVDDMGVGDLSCLTPDSRIRTENLDELAAGGMIFRDGHSSAAVCTPSRYSVLTGRYSFRSRLKKGVTMGYCPPVVEEGRMTVGSLLQGAGYHTACIGKWHLGWNWAKDAAGEIDFTQPIANGPTTAGFDHYFGISASLDMAPYVYIENDRVVVQPDRVIPEVKGKSFYREGPISPGFEHEDVLPTLTRNAMAYLDERADESAQASADDSQPFFLYFPLPAPHTPILPTPEFAGRTGVNAYADFCLQVDDVVGQVMDKLEARGLTDDTIVVFTADHGCSPMADFDELANADHHPSGPYRGHKADIYEGGHRVPYLVRWPATIPAGTECCDTVCSVDLLATMAEIVDQPLPDTAGEDSVSHLPLWRNETRDAPLREATVHQSIDGSLAIRQGPWKLAACPGSGGWSHPKADDPCQGMPRVQLFNLDDDPGETVNRQADEPDRVAALMALLANYVTSGRSTPGKPQPNTPGPIPEPLARAAAAGVRN